MNSFIKRIISGSVFLLIFWALFFTSQIGFSILILAILAEILIFEWKNFFKINDKRFWIIMPIYPILPFILIVLLNNFKYKILLLISFILTFCFDSGAYVTGKLFGKNKICPKISPSKTWEGLFGGIISVILAFVCILLYLHKSINIIFVLIFSIILSLLAFFGDLFESFLKRKAGIKDSGNIMPGHGGFLDRFDSILFVVFFIYIFRDLLTTIF